MKCKKHPCDQSSTIGVCASCLRQRLQSVIVAQSQLTEHRNSIFSNENRESESHSPTPSLVFPRSVSPCVARHDTTVSHHHHHPVQDRSFYSTPQLGPTYKTTSSATNTFDDFVSRSCVKKQKPSRFSLLSNLFLFRSRSEKLETNRKSTEDYSDPSLPSRYSTDVQSSTSCSSSPCRFSTIFSSASRKKEFPAVAASGGSSEPRRLAAMNRGMSPVRDAYINCEFTSMEESGKSFPPAEVSGGGRRGRKPSSAAGSAFCLSPLVRASPGRQWKQKGGFPLQHDTRLAGEIRVPAKPPHLSSAASYCGNRSRKLADFGKVNHNR